MALLLRASRLPAIIRNRNIVIFRLRHGIIIAMFHIPWRRLNWTNTLFLIVTHIVAVVGTLVYLSVHGPTMVAVAILVGYGVMTGFSITAGYHRLFAHATYEGRAILRAFYVLLGSAACQGSVLKWAADHRRHHARVDTSQDPYNIRQGFFYAHIGWVFLKDDPPPDYRTVADLERDPLVRWQHRWCGPLEMAMCFGVPAALGALGGDPWGGLILGGFLRLILTFHSTFSVNSFAHALGRQPYSEDDSSRDSFITAMITLGEGYHNFHHTFPVDYRNGVRPYQFDPSKWLIRGLSFLSVTRNLQCVPLETIVKRRVEVEHRWILSTLKDCRDGVAAARLRALRERLEAWLERWQSLKAEYRRLRRRMDERAADLREQLKAARREFVAARRQWLEIVRSPEVLLATA